MELGADHAINYKSVDFAEEAKKLTGGKGVNVILDMVAGSYVGALSRTLSALDVLERNDLKVAAVVVSETVGSATTPRARSSRQSRPATATGTIRPRVVWIHPSRARTDTEITTIRKLIRRRFRFREMDIRSTERTGIWHRVFRCV